MAGRLSKNRPAEHSMLVMEKAGMLCERSGNDFKYWKQNGYPCILQQMVLQPDQRRLGACTESVSSDTDYQIYSKPQGD